MRTRNRRWKGALVVTGVLLGGACSSGTTTSSPTTTTAAAGGAGSSSTTVAGKGSGQGSEGGATTPASIGPSQLTGELAITNGFKPEVNGFPFQNYGNDKGYTNLTPDEVRRFFGDSVCASTAGGTCELTPPAKQWMEATNDGMAGGHCEGMAALAILLYKGQIKLSELLPDVSTPFEAKIEGNEKLSKEIAYWFATQAIRPAAPEINTLKPSEVVARLRESFAPEATDSYTIGIYKFEDGKKKEGHAITPYGIVDKGDNKFEIAVYDNNFPGQARAVVVDGNAERWTYSAAADPSQPESPYEGGADTFTLTLAPSNARLGKLICPFCEGGGAAGFAKGAAAAQTAGEVGELYLSDAAGAGGVVLTITDLDGAPLPGVVVIDQKNNVDDDAAPVIQVPLDKPFRVTIDGSALKSVVSTDLTLIGPLFDNYIDNINLDPGQVDIAEFNPLTDTVSYETKANESPDIGAGFSTDAADYGFSVGGVDLPSGGRIEVKLDQATGQLSVKNAAADPGTYAFVMQRIDDNGEDEFTNDNVTLEAGGSLVVEYAKWTDNSQKLEANVTTAAGESSPLELPDE